jgi:S1-C subfamily serine protease
MKYAVRPALAVVLLLLAFIPVSLHAEHKSDHRFKNCDKSRKLFGEKGIVHNPDELLAVARDYLSHCSEEVDPERRTDVLLLMGDALVHTRNFSEATPILKECTELASSLGLSGQRAFCWEDLGEAAAYRGNCAGAETAFQVSFDIPTSDNETHHTHVLADQWLDRLRDAETAGILSLPPMKTDACCISQIKCLTPPHSSHPQTSQSQIHAYGTAFFVSADGQLLTNDHVISGCRSLRIGDGENVQVIGRDPKSDLALLSINKHVDRFATFRLGTPVRVGETVMAFGFPLPGTLSSGGSATTGVVSAIAGLGDDPRTFQFSAAVQPGNSGGPLFDDGGHVIGVVEAKLDALRMAEEQSTVPENVGFAIQWAQVRAFLESEGVNPAREKSEFQLELTDVARIAKEITVPVNCTL